MYCNLKSQITKTYVFIFFFCDIVVIDAKVRVKIQQLTEIPEKPKTLFLRSVREIRH